MSMPTKEELSRNITIRQAGSDGKTWEFDAGEAYKVGEYAASQGVTLKPFLVTKDPSGNVHEINPFDADALREAGERGDVRHVEDEAEPGVGDYFSLDALRAGAYGVVEAAKDPTNLLKGVGSAANATVRGIVDGTVGLGLKAMRGVTYAGESIYNAVTGDDNHDLSEGIGKVDSTIHDTLKGMLPNYFTAADRYKKERYRDHSGATEAIETLDGVVEMVASLKGIGAVSKAVAASKAAAGAEAAAAAKAGHVTTAALFGLGKYGDVASDPNGPGGAAQQTAAIVAGTADAVIFGLWNPFKISAEARQQLSPFMEATNKEILKRVSLRLGQMAESGAAMATVEGVKQVAMMDAGAAAGGEWADITYGDAASEILSQFVVGSGFAALEFAEEIPGRVGHYIAKRRQGDIEPGLNDKMKVAMSYQVERARRTLCPERDKQAYYAFDRFRRMGGQAETYKAGLSQAPDVRRVNEDGSVVFNDGSVWRSGKDGENATITISDGTILDAQTGALLGYRPRQESGATPRAENAPVREENAPVRENDAQPREAAKAASNALVLLRQIDDGALPVKDLAIGDIGGAAEQNTGHYIEEWDAAKAKPIIVLEDLEGNLHALTGAKRLAMATAAGDETIKAVVVKEADGWKASDAAGLGAVENLREGTGGIRYVVEAVDTLGAEKVAEVAGWHRKHGDRDFAAHIQRGISVAKKASPELRAALADGTVDEDFAWHAASALSAERVGAGAMDAQRALLKLVGRVGGEELEAVMRGLERRGSKGDVADWDAAVAEERAKFNATKGAERGELDSDLVLVETGDGELKTLGEMEAEAEGKVKRPGSPEIPETPGSPESPGGSGEAAKQPKIISIAKAGIRHDDAKARLAEQRGKDFTNTRTGISARLSAAGANKLISNAAVEKSIANGFTAKQHNEIAANVGALFEDASLVAQRPDRAGDVNIKSIKRFVTPITVDGKDAAAWITVKESIEHGHRIYSVEGIKITALSPTVRRVLADRNSADNAAPSRTELSSSTSKSVSNPPMEVNPADAPGFAAAQGAGANRAVELRPAEDGSGAFSTVSHPHLRVTVDGDRKLYVVKGLTLDDFDGSDPSGIAALVAKIEAMAKASGCGIGFADDGVMKAWEATRRQIRSEAEAAHAVQQNEAKRKTVVERLTQSGLAEGGVVQDKETFDRMLAEKSGQPLEENGVVYGFCDPATKTVYLNPEFFATPEGLETPIHEFGHLGVIACEKVNKAVYDRGMGLAGEFLAKPETAGEGAVRKLVDFVNETYSDFAPEKRAEELLAQLIGKRGAEALKEETDKTVIERVKAWLVEFWRGFGRALGLGDITPEEAADMTLEQVADAIRAEMSSGRKFGEKFAGVEFGPEGARTVVKPVRVKRHLTARQKSVEDYIAKAGGADDPANPETDLLALWVDNGGRLFGKLPFRTETFASQKSKTGVKTVRTAVADEFGESASFYRDLDRFERGIFFGSGKLESGAVGEGLREALESAGITRFTAEDGTVDFDGVIAEFRRQWRNYERGERGLKERREAEVEAMRDADAQKASEGWRTAEVAEDDAENGVNFAALEEFQEYPATIDGRRWTVIDAKDGIVTLSDAAGEDAALYEFNPSSGEMRELPQGDALPEQRDADGNLLFSRSGIYTGTAADYANRSRQGGEDDGPSLKKIGSGEGSQVYGWGLYGSTERGVAEGYATYRDSDHAIIVVDGKEWKPKANAPIGQRTAYEQLDDFANSPEEIAQYCESMEGAHYKAAAKFIRSHKIEIREPHTHLYEQTFFTDRAPGDESHLLKWYEPVSEEQREWVVDGLKDLGGRKEVVDFINRERQQDLDRDGLTWEAVEGENRAPEYYPEDILKDYLEQYLDLHSTGGELYGQLSDALGSPKAASEFLARAGIDGVKYPVDSYGGKGVKDGDKAGWNYVSFRDDNIRVDHKWTDGQLMFSRAASKGGNEYSYAALTARPDMKLVQIEPEKFKNYKSDAERVRDAKDSVVAAGGRRVDGVVKIEMDGSEVVVRSSGIKHRGRKPNLENDMLFPVLGPVLKNAIPINELAPRPEEQGIKRNGKPGRDHNVSNTFVFLGAFGYGNEICPVRIQVAQTNDRRVLDSVDVLKSLNTKVGETWSPAAADLTPHDGGRLRVSPSQDWGAPALADLTRKSPFAPDTVSIAKLLEIAQPLHPKIFSRDVTANLGVPYEANEINARYSRGGAGPEAGFVKLTRVADDAGQGERTDAGIAASVELARTAPVPVTTKGTRYVALPLSEMHALARYLTGHAMPGEMEAGRKLGAAGKASARSRRLKIAADVFGVVDKTDLAGEKEFLKGLGLFRHEDPQWLATHSKAEAAAERGKSEEALSRRLERLADKRISGAAAGGETAARRVYADQLAKIAMSMPHGQPGVLGNIQTVGGAILKHVRGKDAEADSFLDWMDNAKPGARKRGDGERAAGMFGAFLQMPQEVQARAPGWYDAMRSTIAGDAKLRAAFRQATVRMMSQEGHSALEREILRMQDAQTEAAIRKLEAEANEPIKAGGWADVAKEKIVISCDDRMGAALVRVGAKEKAYLAAQKKLMDAAKTEAERMQIKQQTDAFMGRLAQAKNQVELSRTAWERGRNNEDARYQWRVVDLLNELTVRDGMKATDLSLYLDQMRVIETRGLSGSRGQSARQAQLVIDSMKRRLGADFSKIEAAAKKFHAIHEQELLNNPLLEKVLGKGTADYWRSQTNYVTAKRQHSPEELAEIEAARARVAASGAAGGDDVIGQMFKYIGRPQTTARLKGSFADKQEAISATLDKVAEVQRFLRRSEYVIELRDLLKLANVEGVHDFAAGKNELKRGARYGTIGYMENGQRRTLVVPREIADGFERMQTYDTPALKLCAKVNNWARQALIDFNPVYWQRNIARNAGSIEMNMPGMKESAVKRGLRFAFPGLAPVAEIAMTHIVRHMPERMTLGLRKIWGEHTALYYAPKAKRMAMWLTDHNAMQRRLWEAERRGDLGAVQEMEADRRDMLAALKTNMLVGGPAGKMGATDGFLDQSLRTVGKTMMREAQDAAGRSKWQKAADAATWLFRKNAQQQTFEDIVAKFSAYLHDRAQFGKGNNRSTAESGVVVKKNVSIGEGERKGKDTGVVQAIFQPFWNMVEKGVVRNVKAYGERPAETFQKAAWRIVPMVLHGIVASGALAAWILKKHDGDEEAAKNGSLGEVYRYAKDAQRAWQNCSNYVRSNYHVTPLWTDGWTSVVIGMPLTDEERILAPVARFATDAAAVAAGAKTDIEVAKAVRDMTLGAVAPDFKLAGFLPALLDDTVHALWENPQDYYTGGTKYDRDLWTARNESWGMRGRFLAAMGKRLWNDFGGRNVFPVERNGVDNGLGRAPGWVAAMVNDIPLASPILRSFVKVQVGSPKRDAAEITEAERVRAAICRVHARELFEMARKDGRDISFDAERYAATLAEWRDAENLTDDELAKIEAKYLNAWRDYEGAQYNAEGEREKYRSKAQKLGLDAAGVWLDFD